jgi:flagellar motor switch protein FliN/FliY
MSEWPVSCDVSLPKSLSEELKYFWNVPLSISIQLGVRIMKVREILEIKPGSVIELTKRSGGNVDVLVNGSRIAFGEVNVREGSLGVRLIEFNAVD